MRGGTFKLKLRVLHIVSDLPSETFPHTQPFIASQIQSLAKFRIHTDIFNLTECYGSSISKYLKGIIELNKILSKHQYDLIHAHYSYCGWVGRFQKKIPLIVSLMGSDLLGQPNINGKQTIRGYMDILITQVISRFASHIIVKSKRMANKLTIQSNVSVLPNGVDFQLFRPFDRDKSREMLGWEANVPIVLIVGNPHEERKNVRLAISTVKLLKKQIAGAMLYICYGRPQSEVSLIMNAADVLLMTSYWEGSPNVVKEAMASNLPVVSVDVGDVKEVIKGTRHCYLGRYEAKDLANKLSLVLRANERSNGRTRIPDLCSEKIAERLLTLYHHVLRRDS